MRRTCAPKQRCQPVLLLKEPRFHLDDGPGEPNRGGVVAVMEGGLVSCDGGDEG